MSSKRPRLEEDKQLVPITLTSWHQLGTDILCCICDFCDINDLWCLRRSSRIFRSAVQCHTSRCSALHFNASDSSTPQGRTRKKGARTLNKEAGPWHKTRQEDCVARILVELVGSRDSNPNYPSIQLEHLNLSNLSYLSGSQSLVPIFHLPILSSLITLNLSGCCRLDGKILNQCLKNLDETTQTGEWSEETSLSSSSSPPLKHLYLTGCRRIGDESVRGLVMTFRNLETLHLTGCSQMISDPCLIYISNSLAQLKSLNVAGLDRVTDVGFEAIFTRCLELSYLNIDWCKKVRLSFLSSLGSRVLQAVERIDIDEIVRVRNESSPQVFLQTIGLEASNLSSCPSLEVANIAVGHGRNSGLNPGTLACLACASLDNLREVDISGCELVTDNDLKVLATVCAPTLQWLEMRCCNISNEGIQHLASYGCKNLVYLDISACFNIKNEGVISLCPSVLGMDDGCYLLKSLKMASLPHLTDAALSAVSKLNRLILLDVHNCPNITTHGVGQVIRQCQSLLDLNMKDIGNSTRCKRVRHEDRSKLAQFNGKLQQGKATNKTYCGSSCSVGYYSQRSGIKNGVSHQRMYHCIDCSLLQSHGRGICSSCAAVCHKGHRVYLGSVTAFYCDCGFGFLPPAMNCQSLVDFS